MLDSSALRARLDGVRERIARAAGRAGRDPASIRLIAVSKTFPADYIRAAADAGQVDFGENKVQEAIGSAKGAVGAALKDDRMEAEGRAKELEGEARQIADRR